jgi:hypothetical protein
VNKPKHAEGSRNGRYHTIRDYTLLILGSFAFIVGVLLAATGSPYGLGVLAAGGTALGLIPVLQRDKP